jgi:hypothetical protein
MGAVACQCVTQTPLSGAASIVWIKRAYRVRHHELEHREYGLQEKEGVNNKDRGFWAAMVRWGSRGMEVQEGMLLRK